MDYLIVDYSTYDEDKKSICTIVGEKEFFEIMQKAKDEGSFPCIAVYKLPQKPVLDWS